LLRALLVGASLAAVSLLPAAASGQATPQSPIQPRLDAKVGARTISLTKANGERVRVLFQNGYRFQVRDLTTTQNFHLVGPGVNRKTRVGATASTTWTMYLAPGTYVYKSDRNTKLRGVFQVKGAPPA